MELHRQTTSYGERRNIVTFRLLDIQPDSCKCNVSIIYINVKCHNDSKRWTLAWKRLWHFLCKNAGTCSGLTRSRKTHQLHWAESDCTAQCLLDLICRSTGGEHNGTHHSVLSDINRTETPLSTECCATPWYQDRLPYSYTESRAWSSIQCIEKTLSERNYRVKHVNSYKCNLCF